MKKCIKCNLLKKSSSNYFCNSIRYHDGFDVYCKECRNKYNREKQKNIKRCPTIKWIDKICLSCKNNFKVPPTIHRSGGGKYCSLLCTNMSFKFKYRIERQKRIDKGLVSKKQIHNFIYQDKYPEKVRAGRIARAEKHKGNLIKKSCQKCGKLEDIQMHHKDYKKPLDVLWLCAKCHRLEHK